MTLEVRGLSATVDGRTLFAGLELSVAPGTFTAVVGPNGAGKSTLLRGLCGLVPMAGTVHLCGVPLLGTNSRRRAQAIAYLPQQTPSSPGLTVRDVVMLGRLPHRSRLAGPSDDDRRRVEHSLRSVGMQRFLDRPLHTLSGGERQRVMLARMLATEAGIMLLDEPTAALDVRHALELLGTLRNLAADGRAVVVAMHDLTLAYAYADQAVCLPGDGTAVVGPPGTVLTPARLHDVFGADFERDGAGALHLRIPGRLPS